MITIKYVSNIYVQYIYKQAWQYRVSYDIKFRPNFRISLFKHEHQNEASTVQLCFLTHDLSNLMHYSNSIHNQASYRAVTSA